MSTYYTSGSILNLIPAQGVVHFTDKDGESRSVPLIGWGVVVRYSEAEESEKKETTDSPKSEWMWWQSTELQAVILDNKSEPRHPNPMTVAAYLAECSGDISHRIELS